MGQKEDTLIIDKIVIPSTDSAGHPITSVTIKLNYAKPKKKRGAVITGTPIIPKTEVASSPEAEEIFKESSPQQKGSITNKIRRTY